MLSTLFALALVFILVMLWLDGARAREIANGVAAAACNHERLQLLDGTVVLARVGLRWTKRGLRFRRMFAFDYSLDGSQRYSGYLILVGIQVESLQMTDHIPATLVPDTPEPDQSNVVPFRKRTH